MSKDFTETAIKTEQFIRKNKIILITIIVIIIGVFVANKTFTSIQNARAQEASELFFKAADGSASADELAKLQAMNANLSIAAKLMQKQPIAAEELAHADKFLKDAAQMQTGKSELFLKDLGILQKANEAVIAGDLAAARSLAKSIVASSPFYALAQEFLHYKAAE